jgi:DNA-binding transcriptional ArsR family regulator
MDALAKKRLGELAAAASVKHKNKKDTFAKVPLWWLEKAARATRSPQLFVAVWLLHLSWKNGGGLSFPFPNGKLAERGVDRQAKRRALASLEKAGLITVERSDGKTPKVTLVCL